MFSFFVWPKLSISVLTRNEEATARRKKGIPFKGHRPSTDNIFATSSAVETEKIIWVVCLTITHPSIEGWEGF